MGAPDTRTAADPATVYRDATFSRATRDRLAEFLDDLVHHTEQGLPIRRASQIEALRDVIRRWDENDATEIRVLDDGPFLRSAD